MDPNCIPTYKRNFPQRVTDVTCQLIFSVEFRRVIQGHTFYFDKNKVESVWNWNKN